MKMQIYGCTYTFLTLHMRAQAHTLEDRKHVTFGCGIFVIYGRRMVYVGKLSTALKATAKSIAAP